MSTTNTSSFVDLAAVRAEVALLVTADRLEELRRELRGSVRVPDDRLELWVGLVASAVQLIPHRLDELAAAEPGPHASLQFEQVRKGIRAYWGCADDIVPDRRGLVGRVDDAVVVHTVLDRLARFLRAKEPIESTAGGGWPEVDLRIVLDAEVVEAVDLVADRIWYGEFETADVVSLGPDAKVFALSSQLPLTRRTRSARGADQAVVRQCRIWFGTNREPVVGQKGPEFGPERDQSGKVHFGHCDVMIPKTHKFGSTGTNPFIRLLHLDFADDRIRVTGRHSNRDSDEFYGDLRKALTETPGRQLLFYLHGYNAGFDEAAVRTAQLFADLRVDGAAAFFSWPSCGETEHYLHDRDRIEESEAEIAQFLQGLATSLDGATVHIIAHSMGNRGLLRALHRITGMAAGDSGVRFGQIILAAPDISTKLFKELAVVYPSISRRTTMYVSAKDKALDMSGWLAGASRAGLTPPVTVVPEIDTIEVTDIDLSVLGHSYYAEAEAVLYDIDELLRHDPDPGNRMRLRPSVPSQPDQPYWIINA
ncbi:alpha/beta hydrolase [Lentzea waywayandensis]|nr:alpha/beta hydrolase [Lentzea waywayandensis]